jgi:REP element-mobilizing transposase RayT
MPNHLHGIIFVEKDDNSEDGNPLREGYKPSPTDTTTNPINHSANHDVNPKREGYKPSPTIHGLCEIIRGFKTFSAKQINQHRQTQGIAVWQRGYYDHIIRNDADLNRIREYIINNPAQWALDEHNPHPAMPPS